MTDVNNDSPSAPAGAVRINQDANIKAAELAPGQGVELALRGGRQGYLLCVEGAVTATESGAPDEPSRSYTLERHDAAEVYGASAGARASAGSSFSLTAGAEGALLLLVEMEHTGKGRTDL